MLNLLTPGLRAHEHPSYGGWGGRFVRTGDGVDTWALADAAQRPDLASSESSAPSDPSGPSAPAGDEGSVVRWFADAQADFAGRLRWSVTPRYEDANHHPRLAVAPGVDLAVAAGDAVPLTAVADDPDGDGVTVRWWVYAEAGTGALGAVVEPASGSTATVHIPADARAGDTIHVIAEALDDAATHPLKAYQRVILTVR
ncbi:hypothetical protein [Microbacterium sp.]|uniref:hypothetical protein n=1 Tax=Microbacterium sp. TaxID=51671 RepID=UPI0039E6DEB9